MSQFQHFLPISSKIDFEIEWIVIDTDNSIDPLAFKSD